MGRRTLYPSQHRWRLAGIYPCRCTLAAPHEPRARVLQRASAPGGLSKRSPQARLRRAKNKHDDGDGPLPTGAVRPNGPQLDCKQTACLGTAGGGCPDRAARGDAGDARRRQGMRGDAGETCRGRPGEAVSSDLLQMARRRAWHVRRKSENEGSENTALSG